MITNKELYNFNGVLQDGKACNSMPIGADICCWFPKNQTNDIAHGDREPHFFLESAAALGGMKASVGAGLLNTLTATSGLAAFDILGLCKLKLLLIYS